MVGRRPSLLSDGFGGGNAGGGLENVGDAVTATSLTLLVDFSDKSNMY
jgi:hypothetical protein